MVGGADTFKQMNLLIFINKKDMDTTQLIVFNEYFCTKLFPLCNNISSKQSQDTAEELLEKINNDDFPLNRLNSYNSYRNTLFNYGNKFSIDYYTYENMIDAKETSIAFLSWLIDKIDGKDTKFDGHFGFEISFYSKIAFFNLLRNYSFEVDKYMGMWYFKPELVFTNNFVKEIISYYKSIEDKSSNISNNLIDSSKINKFCDIDQFFYVKGSEKINLSKLNNSNDHDIFILQFDIFENFQKSFRESEIYLIAFVH